MQGFEVSVVFFKHNWVLLPLPLFPSGGVVLSLVPHSETLLCWDGEVQIPRASCWLLGRVEQRGKPCLELGWMSQGTWSSGEMAKSLAEGEKIRNR